MSQPSITRAGLLDAANALACILALALALLGAVLAWTEPEPGTPYHMENRR